MQWAGMIPICRPIQKINDLFWFEKDFIAQLLGFDSFDALERHNNGENENDADESDSETEDEDDDES